MFYVYITFLRHAVTLSCRRVHVQGDTKTFELPVKKRSDICTIMYTSGTTGDPKGVMISNNSIVTIVAGVKRFLDSVNESASVLHLIIFLLNNELMSQLFTYMYLKFVQLNVNDVYLSYLPLAHIFDRVIEECFINHGASIGFWRGVRL